MSYIPMCIRTEGVRDISQSEQVPGGIANGDGGSAFMFPDKDD